MSKGFVGNFVFKILADGLADIKLKCPIQPGVYNITNWKINENLIPSFLMRNVSGMFKVEGKGTVSGEKNSVKLVSAKILGRFVKVG